MNGIKIKFKLKDDESELINRWLKTIPEFQREIHIDDEILKRFYRYKNFQVIVYIVEDLETFFEVFIINDEGFDIKSGYERIYEILREIGIRKFNQ